MCIGGISEPVSRAIAPRLAERGVGGVRFRRGGEIDHQLRDRQFALGRAEPVVGVPGGERLHQRLRVGEADILDRGAGQPAQDVDRVLAAGQHARQPIERRIGIRAAQRFVQRADQVVVALLRLVVERRAALHERGQLLRPERRRRRGRRSISSTRLSRKRPSPSAIARNAARPSSVSGSAWPRCASARASRVSSVAVVEPAQHEHLGARQQRADQLEGRVLGRRADEDHRAVLDIGQKRILLGAVEAVDLVDEEQRALAHLAALLAPPRTPCADRRRRKTPPTAARRRGRCRAPAGARSSSCRSPAAPTGSSRRAAGSPPCGRSAPRARADGPGRRCRRGSAAAAGRPAGAAPGFRTAVLIWRMARRDMTGRSRSTRNASPARRPRRLCGNRSSACAEGIFRHDHMQYACARKDIVEVGRSAASTSDARAEPASEVTPCPSPAMPHGTMPAIVRRVGIDVERDAVIGDPAAHPHADRGDLVVLARRLRRPTRRPGRRAARP